MLKIFTAALLATAMIAGPALAAPASDTKAPAATATTATAPAAASTAKTAATTKPLTTGKHTTRHVRKHLARAKLGATHQVQHLKSAKTHQASIAKPAVKTGDKAAM